MIAQEAKDAASERRHPLVGLIVSQALGAFNDNAWKQIVKDHKVRGVKVYDARLVAIMSVYTVESVLTFNSADFERFSNVRAIQPSSLLP